MAALTETPRTRFQAPAETFAPAPAESRGLDRDGIRLLVARQRLLRNRTFRDLPEELAPGDIVVVNNSATVPGELDGRWQGRQVVVHLGSRLDQSDRVVELRTAPHAAEPILDAEPGQSITLADGSALRLLAPYPRADSSPAGSGNRLWRAWSTPDFDSVVAANGRPIAYGYLDRSYPLADYQSVFSTVPGSAESPSAGRPFTDRLLTRLVARGVGLAAITLHTGLSSQDVGEAPQAEWFEVSAHAARTINASRAGGGRVVAVGTTVTRALESAVDGDGRVVASAGWTDRVVTPAHPPRVIGGLVSGWHNPEASHLLLVEAVAGGRLAQAAYDEAVREGYLWHEFGDAALFLPERGAAPERAA